jgi:hypothetical protein
MTLALLLVLGQWSGGSSELNLNQQPVLCMDEGAYCSATRRRTFEVNCSGAGITCTQTAGRMTLTVPGGGAGGGGAPLDGGYLTLTAGSTGSSNERVLTAGSNISITPSAGIATVAVTGTVPSATTATTASALVTNPSDCTAGQYATTIDTGANLTCAQVAYSQLSGTPTIPADVSAASYITRVAEAGLSNETAMGALGTGLVVNTTTTGVPTIYAGTSCTNQFPRSLNASGAATCATVALSTDTSGTLAVGRGGTGQTTITTNQVYVGTALDTLAAKTLPSCSTNSTDKLLYDSATQTWSCGTDQGGAGSGLSFAEVAAANLAGAF